MTATRLGVFELVLVTLLTAALAAFGPRSEAPPPDAPMPYGRGAPVVLYGPDPSPEQPAAPPIVETQSLTDVDVCNDAGVTAVIVRGRITSLDPSMQAHFRLRLADVPSRYEAITGNDGLFEVRIPRRDLGATDLCTLPLRGQHPAASAAFAGSHMTVQYKLYFEH